MIVCATGAGNCVHSFMEQTKAETRTVFSHHYSGTGDTSHYSLSLYVRSVRLYTRCTLLVVMVGSSVLAVTRYVACSSNIICMYTGSSPVFEVPSAYYDDDDDGRFTRIRLCSNTSSRP